MDKVGLGSTGLMVSPIGFGGYRIDNQVAEHHAALTQALLAGINLIDTSSNYTDGGSESLVGRVLDELFQEGKLARQDVVVVSKAGYVQGQNLGISQEREKAGQAWPELVKVQEGLEHCLHPDFLADQLARSLDRLGLLRLDVLLLHNPEYYLEVAHTQGLPMAKARGEYLRRLALAFAFLEGQVQEGRISFYGISSNTFVKPAQDYKFTSLSQAWQAAQKLGADHHFRVVEFPMNLLEPGALLEKNQPGDKSLLELAAELDLGVLINRPLNAIVGQRLLRLAAVEGVPDTPPERDEILAALEELQESEDRLRLGVFPALGWDEQTQRQVGGYLAAAAVLKEHISEFSDLNHLREVEEQYFLPRISAALRHLVQSQDGQEQALTMAQSHLQRVRWAFWVLGGTYRHQAAREAAEVQARAAAADQDWALAPSLSQMALRALRSTSGISCVLLGMRRPAYVEDALAELARPLEQRDRRQAWQRLVL